MGGEDIHVVWNDGSGISVGQLHGRGHVLRRRKGPLLIMRFVIANHVTDANVVSLSRACCARSLRGAMSCPWPVVAVCPSHRPPRSSVGIPPREFRPRIGQDPLREWDDVVPGTGTALGLGV